MKLGVLLFSILCSFQLLAGNLKGLVLAYNSEAPIDECQLLLLENGKVVGSALSNFKGVFSISYKKNRNYVLELVKSGYQTQSIDIFTDESFEEASLNYTIYMKALDLQPKFEKMQEGVIQKTPNPDIMEDIGDISSLPEGYKIIEAKPLKFADEKKTNFNVNLKRVEKTNVNVEVLKEEFNKQSVVENIYSEKEKFPSSYFAEGNIYYGPGKALLTENVKEILNSIAVTLFNESTSVLKLKAYADAERELSIGDYIAKLRVEEISKYLLDRGVRFEQLQISVYGNTNLENGCYEGVECSEFDHQQNRRIELILGQ